MRAGVPSRNDDSLGLRMSSTVTGQEERQKVKLHIAASTARCITGWTIGVVDLFYLSATLIYFALWAVNESPFVDTVTLLSMRISVKHVCMLALCAILWRFIFYYCGLYTWQHIQVVTGLLGRIALATGACALLQAQVIAVEWHHGHYFELFVLDWATTASCALTSRALLICIHTYVKPLFRTHRAVIVVGCVNLARIAKELETHPDWNYTILGVVDSFLDDSSDEKFQRLGGIDDLEEILMRNVVDEVIVALPVKAYYSVIEDVIATCERVGVQVQYPEDLFDVSWSSHCHRVDQDHDRVVLKMVPEDYRSRIKRAIDIVGAIGGLIILSPLFLVAAVLIKSTSKGPIFFRQDRYGLGKRIFCIYKFRTMHQDAEAAQSALEHLNQNTGPVFKIFKDPRITRVGAILRKTSIDELPQLINVLKGEMSLVGPRPLNLRDVGRFSEAWLMRRFSVKPGLTCLWQISGRSNVSFDRWIAMDLHYIDHWSLHLDLRILLLTLPAVIKGTGAA